MPFVPTTDLEDDGGDLVAALEHDRVAEVLQGPLALLRLGLRVEGRPVGVRAPELHEAGDRRLVVEAAALTGETDRRGRPAVVAAVRRQHLQAAGVALRQPDRVLDRLGAGVREEHLLEVAVGARTPSRRGSPSRRSTGPPRCDARWRSSARPCTAVGLVLDRLHHLRVLMAEVHVDELAREVDPRRCRSRPRTSRRAHRR